MTIGAIAYVTRYKVTSKWSARQTPFYAVVTNASARRGHPFEAVVLRPELGVEVCLNSDVDDFDWPSDDKIPPDVWAALVQLKLKGTIT